MELRELVEQDVRLAKVSNRDGGEYHGACPVCHGVDRFVVWPEKGRFWCRETGNGCDFHGDTITYLMRLRGKTFRQAARLVGKQLKAMPARPESDALWEWFEEQYAAIRVETTLVEWASHAIPKAPERYSKEERMEWAVRAVQVAEWYAAVAHLWQKVVLS